MIALEDHCLTVIVPAHGQFEKMSSMPITIGDFESGAVETLLVPSMKRLSAPSPCRKSSSLSRLCRLCQVYPTKILNFHLRRSICNILGLSYLVSVRLPLGQARGCSHLEEVGGARGLQDATQSQKGLFCVKTLPDEGKCFLRSLLCWTVSRSFIILVVNLDVLREDMLHIRPDARLRSSSHHTWPFPSTT